MARHPRRRGPAGDSATAAQAEFRFAVALCSRGRHAEAQPVIENCVMAFRQHANQPALASARYWHAVCQFNLGHFQDARQIATDALDLARRRAALQTQFLALRILAVSHAALPEGGGHAIESSDQALAIVRQLGQPTWELEVMHSAAHVANLTGRPQVAMELSQQAFKLGHEVAAAFTEADWLGIMGDAYQSLGRHQEAVAAFSKALPVFHARFMSRHQALCLLKLGLAHRAMGEYRQALVTLEESLSLFRELRLAHYERQAVREIEICRRQA